MCSEFDERTHNLRQKIPDDETRLHENQNMPVSKHLHSTNITNIIHLESNWPLVFVFFCGGWAAPFYGSNLPPYSCPIGFYRHLLYLKDNDSRGLTSQSIHQSHRLDDDVEYSAIGSYPKQSCEPKQSVPEMQPNDFLEIWRTCPITTL